MDKHADQSQELESLRSRLEEAEETLRAIKAGEVDALVLDTGSGDQVYTLRTAETAYRVAIESINEGVLTLSADGIIMYANCAMGYLLNKPLEQLTGASVYDFTDAVNGESLRALLENGSGRQELNFKASEGMTVSTLVSITALPAATSPVLTLVAVVTDLTELKRRDEVIAQGKLLRESEARLAEAERIGHIGNWEWNIETGSLYWSAGLFAIYGLNPETFSPTMDSFAKFVHPDDRVLVNQMTSRIMSGEKNVNFDFKIIAADGSTRCLNAKGTIKEFDESGKPLLMAGVNQDITDRKRAEDNLKVQARMLDTVADAVIATDMQGRITYWNDAATAIYGWERSEVLGQDVVKVTTPAMSHEQANEILSNLVKGQNWHGEFSVHRKDGTVFQVAGSDSAVKDGEGNITAIIGITRDITKRKAAEQAIAAAQRQIQSIIDNTTSIIYAFDREERFLIVNNPLAELLNSTPEQMIGKRRHEFMPEEDAHWHENNDRQVFESGIAREFEEYSQLNGRSITWLTTKYPLRDTEGKIYAVGGISADITERKKMEAELAAAKEHLEEQVEERTHELWAQVETTKQAEAELRALSTKVLVAQEEERRSIARELHDEIGQTLTVVKLMLNSLEKSPPDNLKPRTEAISKEVTHVMAHVRLMAQTLRPTVLDDLGLVPGLQWLFDRLKEQAGLQIEFDCSKLGKLEQNTSITAYRIIQESLTNVMRHSGVKSAFVQIALDGDQLRLRVADYGRGFDAKTLQTSTGLSAMRERAKLVGGRVTIESAPGRGTVITAMIPCQ